MFAGDSRDKYISSFILVYIPSLEWDIYIYVQFGQPLFDALKRSLPLVLEHYNEFVYISEMIYIFQNGIRITHKCGLEQKINIGKGVSQLHTSDSIFGYSIGSLLLYNCSGPEISRLVERIIVG